MYSSANYVVFVNYEDFDKNIEDLVSSNPNENLTFFSGYDCDSLALENITGFVEHTLPVFQKFDNAVLELRTKSIQLKPLFEFTPMKNCVIAFSLMPKAMSESLDHKAPKISERIKAISKLAKLGWKIGLRFDPLIQLEGGGAHTRFSHWTTVVLRVVQTRHSEEQLRGFGACDVESERK